MNLSRLRTGAAKRPIVVALSFLAILLVTRFFPNPGVKGPGTPSGVLLMGIIYGAIGALISVGVVLVYRTSRIVNFAQAALGAVGAAFAANAVTALHWPYGLAFVVAILLSAAVGLICELILRRFFDAPRLVLTVGTLGAMGLVQTFASSVPFLPIWGDDTRSITDRAAPIIKPLRSFHWGPSLFGFEFAHLLALILAPLALLAIAFFLTRTKMGVAVRAAAENVERAEMLGINVRLLTTVVWSLAGALGGIAVTLRATITTFALGGVTSVEWLLPALGAAVLSGMRSLPIATAAAVGISVLDRAIYWSFPDQARALTSILLLVIIVAGPLLMKKVRGREREVSSWEASQEARAMPRELVAVDEIRTWRSIAIGIGAFAVLIFPWVTTTGPINTASFAAIGGIVILSLVVLTGWTGQVSLGQWGLVAVGALVGGALTNKAGLSFWLAVPIGALVTAGVAALLAIPALRIRGLMLAVSTFAFSFVAYLVLFNEQWFGWLIPERVDRPTLFFFDFEDERSMYYLAVAVFALCYAVVKRLRRSRPGRVLLALRENEDDLMTAGINPITTRIAGFALAGFLAGLAGVLLAHQQRSVGQSSFEPVESLQVFLYAIIGGLGSPMGAVLGSVIRAVQQFAPTDPILAFFLNPSFGVLMILYLAPRGLAGLVHDARDSILRVVAQRRGIVVPSLFADADAEAIERRLVLLGEPQDGRGLDALPPERRYRLASAIHAGQRRHGAGAPDERTALSGAAAALLERELASSGNGTARGREE